jgi:uncharacterized membrane-anchored protein YitT (DUF2179 family)
MRNYFIPATGIILVTIVLVLINEFTETTVIKDYALIFIIAGMLLGVGLAKLPSRKKSKD